MREGLIGIDKYVFNPKIEMVYWADLLYEKPLDETITDSKSPFYLDDRYTTRPSIPPEKKTETRKKVLDFIEKQIDKLFLNEDNTINHAFISDFIISKYFKDLGIYYDKGSCINSSSCARDKIRERLTNLLTRHKNDDIFLVSHSMGSIVAYDVLTLLLSGSRINTFATIGSPLGIPIVKGKIASEYKEQFRKDFIPSTPPGIIKHWYNFSDIQDKVAMNYSLADDYEENEKGIKVIDYFVNNDYTINNEFNPHKAYGYLRTPEFAKTLYEFLISDKNKILIWFWDLKNKLLIWLIKKNVRLLEKINPFLFGETNF